MQATAKNANMDAINLLYVEDEAIQRQEVAAQLEAKGFRLAVASSGQEAVIHFRASGADVVLCDLHMPGMDGLQVLNEIKALAPATPVIILTARGTIEQAVQAIRQGAYDFVLKPAEINQIETSIHQALENARLQEQLKQSESNFKMLLETVPDLVYSLDTNGNFLNISPAGERLLGYKASEMLGRAVFDFVHPEDRGTLRAGFQRAMTTGDSKIKTLQFRMLCKSGKTRYFEANRRLIFENGKVIRQDGIARDITKRKQLEQELQQHSEQLEKKVNERTEKLEYTMRQLTALNTASNRFTQIFDENELMDEIPELLTHTLDFDRAFFILEDQGKLTLRSYCLEKDTPELAQSFLERVQSDKFVLPPQFMQSFRENRTIFIPDLNADPHWPREDDKPIRTKALVMAPVRVNKKPIGLVVGNMQHHEREMDEQDVQRFEMFSNMVGLALDNIRAYQSLERKVIERTKSLREANRELRAKTKQLESQTYSLGKANVELLAMKEELEEKNLEMETLLNKITESNRRLEAILDSSQNAIIMVDLDNKIIASNRRARDFFCLDVNTMLGMQLTEFHKLIRNCFVPPEAFERLANYLLKNPDTDLDSLHDIEKLYERSLELHTGELKYVSAFAIPVTDKENHKLGSVWTYTDITKMKRADEQLRAIVEASPIPFIVTRRKDGKILYANEPMAEIVGLKRQEVVGKHTIDFYANAEDRKIVLDKIAKEGSVRNYEVQIKKADGTTTWMIFSIEPEVIGDEAVLIGSLYDINERKKAEDALRESEERFRQLNENIKEVFWMVDLQLHKMIYVSPSYEEIFGRPRSALYEEPEDWLQAVHPEDMEKLSGDMAQAGRQENEQEFRIIRGQGEIRWIRSRAFPVRNEQGEIFRYCGVSEDVTERKLAEEKLRLYKQIFMNSNDPITILDPQGVLVEQNPASRKLNGYSDEELIGKTPGVFVGEETFAQIGEALRKTGNFRGEIKSHPKTGAPIDVELSAFTMYNDKGEVTYRIGFARDITERKRQELALQQSLQELEKANQHLRETQDQLVQSEKMASLGMLVAGIAHEINTPIGAVHSMHDTLKRAVEKLKNTLKASYGEDFETDSNLHGPIKVIQDANRVIDTGSERVTTIVRRLKSFARLDEAELKTIDIHEGIEDTLTLIHHEIKHNVEVIKDYAQLPPIPCYPGRLNQVYLNLFINAKQAIANKPGEIRITTAQKNGRLEIRIRDNGPGIPKDKIKKIFDPGFTTKGVGVGTGLGLSICYQIIQDHKGEIKVESEMGKGTTFIITLPMNLDELLGN